MTSAPAVTFVYADWIAAYPVFSNVSSGAALNFFNIATLYCSNQLNPVRTVAELTTLLYMLTAHIAWLQSPRDSTGQPSSSGTEFPALVGRVSGATEGSVSVQTENQYPAGTAQWYQQSPWGSAYWEAIKRYRTMRYRPGIRPVPWPGGPWLYPNGS